MAEQEKVQFVRGVLTIKGQLFRLRHRGPTHQRGKVFGTAIAAQRLQQRKDALQTIEPFHLRRRDYPPAWIARPLRRLRPAFAA